jgi:hypothetical protein
VLIRLLRRSVLTVLALVTVAAPAAARGFVTVDAKTRTEIKEWTPRQTRLLEHIEGFDRATSPAKRTPYGGRAGRTLQKTGFFHTQRVGDRWWLVDPTGAPFIAAGVCTVRMNWTTAGVRSMERQFGTRANWARKTRELLVGHGFNCFGAWSQNKRFRELGQRFPYTVMVNCAAQYARLGDAAYTGTGHFRYKGDCPPIFDRQFPAFCRGLARRKLRALKDDPWLLGWFSDNELPFHRKMLSRYLALHKDDPGRAAAEKWCRANGVDPAAREFALEHQAAFLKHVATTYFRIVSEAVRSVDPNHLFLGCRFYGPSLRYPELFAACGPYVDVVSCNIYGVWTPDRSRTAMWTRESKRPFLVSEFYAKGMDSQMANLSGAGFTVRTQVDRGRFYQHFTLSLLEQPGCVGWHWFRYMDNDPDNTWADGSNRNSNKGIVTARYEPWTELIDRMKAVNTRAYELVDHFDRSAPKPAFVVKPNEKQPTRRVILLIIDGLAVGAPKRFGMTNWLALAKEGCLYEAMHLPLPGHPKKSERYPWSCSMPNPMLMAGTPFIGREGIRESMIQHQFRPADAAFVVNAYSYKDVSGGFGIYVSRPHQPDAVSVEKAKPVLLEQKPVFLRLHLQRPGIEGEKVSKKKYAGEPWHRNIWHENSLYRRACVQADRELGRFVAWLKERKLWTSTTLLICGDHGQADEGWHEPYSPKSTMTPLVIVGAGVAGGRTFPYCEIFDLAPTIASLTARKAPPLSVGRVLDEAFDAKATAPTVGRHIQRLNEILRAANRLPAAKQDTLRKSGFLFLDDVGRWHTTPAGDDFAAFVERQKKLLASGQP